MYYNESMKKIAFFSTMDSKQFLSTIPFVEELIRRGYTISYYSFDLFQNKIEEIGALYYSLNQYVDNEKEKNPAIASIIQNLKITKNSIQELNKKFEEEKVDLIIADQNAYWAKLIAKKQDIPLILYTSDFVMNRYTSKYSKNQFGDYIQMALGMSKVSDLIKELQQLGYVMNNPLNFLQVEEEETLIFMSEEFHPYAETFAKNYHFVGPMLKKEYQKVAHDTKTISVFYDGDELDFKEHCIQACIELGMEYKEYQSYQLNKSDLLIASGTIESINESIYLGIPMVLYPKDTSEQAYAQRVVELGIGAMLRFNTTEDIKQAITFVLNNKQYLKRVEELSIESHHNLGLEETIQLIEEKIKD